MHMDPLRTAERLGYRVCLIPHERIKEYIACYRVMYKGKEIYPGAALRLGIPLNEIWVSDAFRDFLDYMLFHELREIQHRYEGYSQDRAHLMALKDEENEFNVDERWLRLKSEINVCTMGALLSTHGIGKELALRIMDNRPYDGMDELLRVKGIGKKRLNELKKRFWCILEG